MALTLALLGLGATLVGLVVYFSTIVKHQVPERPVGFIGALIIGIALSSTALWMEVTVGIAIPAVLSILTGVIFLWILTLRKTPLGDIKVKVGDTVFPFKSQTDANQPFDETAFQGKRTLLKFHRGAWCPYCCAELKQFEEMKPQLQQFKVDLVALSGDTVEDCKKHKVRDNLSHTLLADPNLTVVKQYGLEHQKALGGNLGSTLTLFGIPFPMMMKFKSMSVPTTLLIDESGVIRWIDQSADYRLRANEQTVMAAVRQVFGNE